MKGKTYCKIFIELDGPTVPQWKNQTDEYDVYESDDDPNSIDKYSSPKTNK